MQGDNCDGSPANVSVSVIAEQSPQSTPASALAGDGGGNSITGCPSGCSLPVLRPDLQSVHAGPGCSGAAWIVMAGGQGAPETGAGLSRRTNGPSETGDLRRSRLEPRHVLEAAKTEGAVAIKPRAPMIRKQLQVGVFCSGEPRWHAGMLAMQICPGNRSSLSLSAVPSTTEHIGANHHDAGERHELAAVISADAAEAGCSTGHIFDRVYL